MDLSKRFTLNTIGSAAMVVSSGGILLPGRAKADPATFMVLLGTIIGAAMQYLSAKESAKINADAQMKSAEMQFAIERMKQDYQFRMMRYQLGDTGVLQETALDRRRNLAKYGWSDNIDGIGSYLGLSKGQIATERGHYQGTISTAEANRFAIGVARGNPMPVPVEGGYHPYSARESDKIQVILRDVIGQDAKLIGGRHFSTARNPTENGWDLETVMFANKSGTGTVNAAIVPRRFLI